MSTEEKKDEAFLSRWSRLKREGAKPPAKQDDSPAPVLPPLEELTPASDFKAFMHPKVEDALRRVALKKLFSDPHFNVPDPYEAYSGDWTVGEAIPEEMLKGLEQMKTLLSQPPAPAPTEPEGVAAEESKEMPPADEPGRKDA